MLTSPVPYLTDEEYRSYTLPERALHVYRAEELAGVREVPIGSNRGPRVDQYLRSCGYVNVPAPWCGCFVTWCLIQAGADPSKLRKAVGSPASTYFWYQWALQRGHLRKTPKRGDLFVWNGAGGGHMGFVLGVDGNKFRSGEGNTNDAGEREGYEVADRERNVVLPNMPRKGFIDLTTVKWDVGV